MLTRKEPEHQDRDKVSPSQIPAGIWSTDLGEGLGWGARWQEGSLPLFSSALHSFKVSVEFTTKGISCFCQPGVNSLSLFFLWGILSFSTLCPLDSGEDS